MLCAAVLAAIVSPCLAGCGGDEPQAPPPPIAEGGALRLLDGVEFDHDNMFFDDFTNGVDPENWYIGKQAWGANGNGGVIPQNVNYTDDGILVLTGNGDYYTSGGVRGVGTRKDGTLAGAALISKFLTCAGRYEVKMKVLPRLGACNAFWTFAYDNDTNANHEIDIELPGGTHSTGIISYERLLNTNYHTETANQSQDKSISEKSGGNITNFVDGKWHTFGFDWYTLEPGEDSSKFGLSNGDDDVSLGKVVYHVDGVVTAVSDAFVPFMQTRLWLGVWFPNNPGFVGSADFETDNMYVDWVRYTPFKDQPYKEFTPQLTGDVASESEYPSSPITLENINKIANGDFEYARNGAANSGWAPYVRRIKSEDRAAIKKRIEEENPESTNSEIKQMVEAYIRAIEDGEGMDYMTVGQSLGDKGSCGLRIEKIGLMTQKIDSIFDGMTLKFDFSARGVGEFNILFMGYGDDAISSKKIEISSESAFKAFTETIVAPAGTKRVEIEISSAFYTPLDIDDISLTVVGQ